MNMIPRTLYEEDTYSGIFEGKLIVLVVVPENFQGELRVNKLPAPIKSNYPR